MQFLRHLSSVVCQICACVCGGGGGDKLTNKKKLLLLLISVNKIDKRVGFYHYYSSHTVAE
jgi:hypothetical protein